MYIYIYIHSNTVHMYIYNVIKRARKPLRVLMSVSKVNNQESLQTIADSYGNVEVNNRESLQAVADFYFDYYHYHYYYYYYYHYYYFIVHCYYYYY